MQAVSIVLDERNLDRMHSGSFGQLRRELLGVGVQSHTDHVDEQHEVTGKKNISTQTDDFLAKKGGGTSLFDSPVRKTDTEAVVKENLVNHFNEGPSM